MASLVALMAAVWAAPTRALVVTVNSGQWDVTTFTGTYLANSALFALPANGGVMPWWNDSALSQQFATAVYSQMGYPNGAGTIGPYFAYATTGAQLNTYAWNTTTGNAAAINTLNWENVTYAQATAVPGPLPILGAVAAFGWSRKLRRRIRAAREATT